MKKTILILAAAAAMCGFAAPMFTMRAVELKAGDCKVPAPCNAIAVHAISTNASGKVTLKKVTVLNDTWTETKTITNVTYTTAWSNLTHTVTNDVVSAWRTNTVNGVLTSNYLARAVNALPSVYPYADLIYVTNKAPVNVVYTNIPYQVASGFRVTQQTTPHTITKAVTNNLCDVTLSSGFKTNALSCLIAPGEFIYASGTAFSGGKVQLIITK